MRIAAGLTFSLLVSVGTLLFLTESANRQSRRLRNTNNRVLYNYSNRNGSSSSSSSSSSYNSAYNKYSGYSGGGSSSSSSNSNSNSNSGQASYGNNYANYQENSSNNQQNYDNQDYDNSNYIWQGDDDDNYGNDDASYYNSNSNYKANSNYYNGRDQQWGGQSVQQYTDDEVPQVYVEGKGDDDEDHWSIFSKFGELSAKETAAVSILAAVFSLFLLFLLGCGCNFADIIQLYCCCGIFRHKNQETKDANQDTIIDGFVKLGDY